ncbi:antitoxin MazE family protein [Solidesulfovibrio sp.]|uniref:antitoxin MazE family protein n=1 Tax=Solidesulfovibrio sp. TaxID=2910990 RepID=UPI00260982FB|nr:antitoxin MazE family protein [Solidesulfovibrio sp.]
MQSDPLTPSQKMRQYRCKMKLKGLRSVQIWVPDTRSPAISRELARQSVLASRAPEEGEVMAFLDDVRAWDDA